MDARTNERIARQWLAAFNAHDLDALLALYADDAEHYSPKLRAYLPKTNGLVRGREALRAWWKDSFDRIPTLQYEVLHITADSEQAFMEYLRHVQGEEDLRVGEVLRIAGSRIVASRVYHG